MSSAATWVVGVVAVGVGIVLAALLVVLTSGARAARPRRCAGCGRALRPSWPECPSCGRSVPAPVGEVECAGGPMAGQVRELTQEITTLGSAEASSIVIADASVARKHAGIRRARVGYALADLGSAEGVFVNGQRTAKRMLRAGDT